MNNCTMGVPPIAEARPAELGKDNDNKALVLEARESNLDDLIRNHSLLIIDCWAPWCSPCRMLSPIIDELAAEYQGKITFARLNTDENQPAVAKYQIMAIPTLLIFKDGKLIGRKTGALPEKVLEAELAKYT